MSELPGAASDQISLTQEKMNNLLSTCVHLDFLFPVAKANPNGKAPECQPWAGMEAGEEGRVVWGAASWGGSSASAGARQDLGRRQRGPQVCICPAHTCKACALLDRRQRRQGCVPGCREDADCSQDWSWDLPECSQIPELRQPCVALRAKWDPVVGGQG